MPSKERGLLVASVSVDPRYNKTFFKDIQIKQCNYLNNRVEGDHRFIEWRTQNMVGFKSFYSASRTLTGLEIVRMIKKERIRHSMATTHKTFYSFAA